MAANLTPQYEAEEAFKKASTIEEKISALEKCWRLFPSTKGRKRSGGSEERLSKLRDEDRKAKPWADPFHVERQGAGQVAMLGFPNIGKSSLLAA